MQVDKKTLAVLAQRGWQAGAGLITLFCIARYLSPAEQGYYYTFASLAGLQALLDMGLSTILVQQAAHEFAELTWLPHGAVVGKNVGRYLALTKKALYWYGASGLLFLLVYPGGLYFFSHRPQESDLAWQQPWLVLVVSTAVGLALLPVLAIVEGSGKVVEVYSLRLVQGIVGAIAIWCTLMQGGGLYAVAMMPASAALIALVWALFRYPKLWVSALFGISGDFGWWRELWPMQWRLGISWLCGYFLTQMHTPLLFQTQNAVVAGQMGVTMTVCNMLGLLSLAWMTSRIPVLAKAAGQQDWDLLDKEFKKGFKRSLAVFVLGAVFFVLIRYAADYTVYGVRFLPFWETFVLIGAILFAHISGLLAIYLRAHRKEPFLWLSLSGALLTVGGSVWLAPSWGSAGIVLVLFLVNVGFGFPTSLVMWVMLRKKWHAII
ncbi:hypothetical protein CWO84_22610 [Methylomonas sp. Kb3]|uniref:lipopolysaccharide biosynthesis protein n=1 Tax=Methylomonas sp. Kb3 TaxID=1611544 RepID=UPI000C34568F|nr:hypothetical protein [Methylomonas sp. Kb3]PKD38036.1 hypothetical protein CWO84_22610 [Methylomonas sp. Kb3]